MTSGKHRSKWRLHTIPTEGAVEWSLDLLSSRFVEIEELECEVREEIRIREQAYRPLAEA